MQLISTGFGAHDGIELGGKLYVKINGFSISEVSTLMDDPLCFCSLKSECEGVYYLCKSTLSEDEARVTHRISVPTDAHSLSEGLETEDITVEDAVHKECVFTRRITSSTETEFRLNVSKGCDAYFYKSYKIASRSVNCVMILAKPGSPTLDGGVNAREQRMIILLLGSISYDPLKMTVTARPGESGLAFISGNIMDFSRLGSLAIRYLQAKDKKCLPVEKRLLLNLKCRSINGAIFQSSLDRRILLEDFPDTVKAFALSGDTGSAKAEILRICDLMGINERLAPFYPWHCDESDPVSALYFVYGVKQYFDLISDPYLLKKLKPLLKSVMMLAISGQRGGMLPEISTSFCYETGLLSEEARYNGSSVTSALMAECLLWMAEIFSTENDFEGDEKIRDFFQRTLEACLEVYVGHMVVLGKIAHNYPGRDDLLRRARFIYGRCMGCIEKGGAVYEGLVERTCKGVYLCPECYGIHNTAYVHKKSKKVFTAWAAVWAVKSRAVREYVGKKLLLANIKPYFEAYKGKMHQRATKEDAYMLEAAIYLDQRDHARDIYTVLINNKDAFGGFGKYSDAEGSSGDDFHAGASAAVYNALELYKRYEADNIF